MQTPTKIHMAMKGSRSESQKEDQIDVVVGKMKLPNTKMIVGSLAKYDALIGMLFLTQPGVTIACGKLTIDFPKHKVRANCTPTSKLMRAAVVSTEEIMEQHAAVFPDTMPEGLPPFRKIKHRIRLKERVEPKQLPTYSQQERHPAALSE
jgi:hypothetical protein